MQSNTNNNKLVINGTSIFRFWINQFTAWVDDDNDDNIMYYTGDYFWATIVAMIWWLWPQFQPAGPRSKSGCWSPVRRWQHSGSTTTMVTSGARNSTAMWCWFWYPSRPWRSQWLPRTIALRLSANGHRLNDIHALEAKYHYQLQCRTRLIYFIPI